MLRGKFAALNTYIWKKEVSKINDVIFHLKRPEKEKQIKAHVSTRVKTNEMENIKTIEKNQWNQ